MKSGQPKIYIQPEHRSVIYNFSFFFSAISHLILDKLCIEGDKEQNYGFSYVKQYFFVYLIRTQKLIYNNQEVYNKKILLYIKKFIFFSHNPHNLSFV